MELQNPFPHGPFLVASSQRHRVYISDALRQLLGAHTKDFLAAWHLETSEHAPQTQTLNYMPYLLGSGTSSGAGKDRLSFESCTS